MKHFQKTVWILSFTMKHFQEVGNIFRKSLKGPGPQRFSAAGVGKTIQTTLNFLYCRGPILKKFKLRIAGGSILYFYGSYIAWVLCYYMSIKKLPLGFVESYEQYDSIFYVFHMGKINMCRLFFLIYMPNFKIFGFSILPAIF